MRPLCHSVFLKLPPSPFLPQASNPLVMVQAYRLLAAEQYAKGWDYPLHLGREGGREGGRGGGREGEKRR